MSCREGTNTARQEDFLSWGAHTTAKRISCRGEAYTTAQELLS